MRPLSRKVRVQEWKNNAKIEVPIYDHYGVEARKYNHGRKEQNHLYVATVGIVDKR